MTVRQIALHRGVKNKRTKCFPNVESLGKKMFIKTVILVRNACPY